MIRSVTSVTTAGLRPTPPPARGYVNTLLAEHSAVFTMSDMLVKLAAEAAVVLTY